ncbi:hypothetical protein BDN72DRAFT_208752 [Pluteus cervinus]|uniref:Uncharacterized protein n=1 Tax=Pluteus cervinus TaxID=181527 RepID=A0ACD3AHY4_9AGAR|nr:hypothetical protein BDN72DRAFT_208752 [Pluteus cervinus]
MASGPSPSPRPPLQILPGQSNPLSGATLAPSGDLESLTPYSQPSHPKAESTSTNRENEKVTEQEEDASTPTTTTKLGAVINWVLDKAKVHKIPLFYIPRISATVLLLLAPWIFFGVVFHKGQLLLSRSAADQVSNNPRITTHIVVTLSGIVASVVTVLFSSAVVCVVQKLTAISAPTEPTTSISLPRAVRVRYLGRFANVGQLKLIFAFNSRGAIAASALAGVLFLAGNQLVAGISAMFAPQPITLNTTLAGREIDFSATDSACLDWYTSNPPPQNCGYQRVGDFVFTSCLGENQLSDVIQAGRDNAAFPNSSLPTTFPRMDGTHFFGLFPGVLLAGPNGLGPINPVFPDDPMAFAESPTPGRSYNYTLSLQGVSIDVTCSNQSSTIISVVPVANDLIGSSLQWSATCPDGSSDILELPGGNYTTPVSGLSMGVWACKQNATNSGSLSYTIYLEGVNTYKPTVGKMSCSVAVALADYSIGYRGDAGYFETIEGPTIISQTSNSPNVFTSVFDEVIRRNAGVIMDGQTVLQGNQVAEAMLAIGAEYYGLDQTTSDNAYTAIMSSVLQAMLNYQAGYLRLIYSGADAALLPLSQCLRDISGAASYPWVGWSTGSGQFDPAFLAAYTVVLLLSLALYIIALRMEKPYDAWNPTDPTDIGAAGHRNELRFTGQEGKDGAGAIVTRVPLSKV